MDEIMKREYITLMIISFLLSFMSLVLMGMSLENGMELFSLFTISLMISVVSLIYSILRLRKEE